MSLGQPGVQFCKPAEAKTLARRCNDYSAELNAKHGKRFGAFGTVSMWNVKDAVEEVGYCLDTLKFAGVSLFASYDGKFLGDAQVRSGDGGAERARRRGVRASRHASAQQADRPAVAVLHDGISVRHHARGGEPDLRRRAGALSAHPFHPAACRRAGAVFLLAAVGVADDRQAAQAVVAGAGLRAAPALLVRQRAVARRADLGLPGERRGAGPDRVRHRLAVRQRAT